MDREIKYSDPPYAALPRDNLIGRILGLGPKVEVCEDLFYALLWCKLEEQGDSRDWALVQEFFDDVANIYYYIAGRNIHIVKG